MHPTPFPHPRIPPPCHISTCCILLKVTELRVAAAQWAFLPLNTLISYDIYTATLMIERVTVFCPIVNYLNMWKQPDYTLNFLIVSFSL